MKRTVENNLINIQVMKKNELTIIMYNIKKRPNGNGYANQTQKNAPVNELGFEYLKR